MSSSKERGKRFIALLNKREKLVGTRIFYMLYNLAVSEYIVNRNYQELSSAMGKYEKNLSIWDVKKRPQLDAFLREFRRLMHNYLSSTYSLIQHTIICRRELNRPSLNRVYSLKVKALLTNRCVRFVRDLRTYCQHIKLPLVSAELTFDARKIGAEKLKQRILIEKKELPKWKRWNRLSKKYIGSHKDIEPKAIFSEYQVLVKDFYKWFYKKVEELYSRELQEFGRIEAELAKLAP